MLLDDLSARAQPEVKGITEDNLCADGMDIARQHAFDRAIGADWHKCWSFDCAAIESERAATGFAIGGV